MHFAGIFPEKYRTRMEFEEGLVAEDVAGRGELWRQEKESCGCQTRFVILIVFREGRKARANNFRAPYTYEILSLVSE